MSSSQTLLDSDRLLQIHPHLQDAIDALKPEQGALVVYTSGTTGRPKGKYLPVVLLCCSIAPTGCSLKIG